MNFIQWNFWCIMHNVIFSSITAVPQISLCYLKPDKFFALSVFNEIICIGVQGLKLTPSASGS